MTTGFEEVATIVKFFLDSLEQWQTLASGALALLAALFGVYFLNRQIRKTQRIEDARISRKHIAARVMLPLALTRIMEYARGIGRELKRVYMNAQGDVIGSDEIKSRCPNPQLIDF